MRWIKEAQRTIKRNILNNNMYVSRYRRRYTTYIAQYGGIARDPKMLTMKIYINLSIYRYTIQSQIYLYKAPLWYSCVAFQCETGNRIISSFTSRHTHTHNSISNYKWLGKFKRFSSIVFVFVKLLQMIKQMFDYTEFAPLCTHTRTTLTMTMNEWRSFSYISFTFFFHFAWTNWNYRTEKCDQWMILYNKCGSDSINHSSHIHYSWHIFCMQ